MKTLNWAILLAPAIVLAAGCRAQRDPTELHPEVAVVRIVTLCDDPGQVSQGRGFLVSGDGWIITRLHLVRRDAQVLVTPHGAKEVKAEIVQEDKDSDLAILKIPGEHHPFLKFFDGDVVPPMHVRVIGSDGISHGVFDHWENVGRDMAFNARVGFTDGGAPLLADDGRVVGVVRGLSENPSTGNDATPIWHVLQMMPKLAHPAPFRPE